jgi:hypothetical protein
MMIFCRIELKLKYLIYSEKVIKNKLSNNLFGNTGFSFLNIYCIHIVYYITLIYYLIHKYPFLK